MKSLEAALVALLALAFLPPAAFAERLEVPPLPVSPFADTEVSTNVPFAVDGRHARDIEMSFLLDGCRSNCVQVAFGRDADGDGTLSFAETETLYGWRNGRRFLESVPDGVRICEAAAEPGDAGCFVVDIRLAKGHVPAGFSATNLLGSAVFADLPQSARAWLFRPHWDTVRVTRRGPGAPAGWFVCEDRARYLHMILR